MSELVLYHYPLRACSLVTVNALIEAEIAFEDTVIDIRAGEQNGQAYRKIHPFGKVPALSVDGHILIENVAILLYIDAIRPHVILPAAESPLDRAAFHADLVWCTATLHTAVRQVRMPMRYTDADISGVQAKGLDEMSRILDVVEKRLSHDRWWYGDTWSIVDVYLNWGLVTAASTDLLPLAQYPAIRSHMKNVRERAGFQAAWERQLAAKERAGLKFPDEASWNANVD
ncbi:MAG: glutathione S-transferase family protein [Pseudomonadota bacterium]